MTEERANGPGWIKLWRSLLKDALWMAMTDSQRVALVGLLLSVNWEEKDHICPRCWKKITVGPGMTTKSIRDLSRGIGVSRKVMHGVLQKLDAIGFLRREKSENRGQCHCLYIINNWEKYQGENEGWDRRGDSEGDNLGDNLGDSEGDRYYIKKVKNISLCSKSEDSEPSDPPKKPKTVAPLPTEAHEMADLLRECIVEEKPDHKLAKVDWLKSPQRDKWAKDFDLMNRRDGRSWEDIAEIIRWVAQDDFWGPNVQSAGKLRLQFDRLQAVMRRPKSNSNSSTRPMYEQQQSFRILDPNS